MNTISSIDNIKIKELKKLQSKKYRDIHDKFLVEGVHLVEEAYKANLLEEIYILEDTNVTMDIKHTFISNKVMKYLSSLESISTIIGVVRKKQEKFEYGNKILYLDNIQDPGNLGTIIRSAYAFNLDTLILSIDTVDLYNEKVIRASQGMLFKQDIIICDESIFSELKNKNYTIYGTDVKDGINIKTIENKDKSVIIIGNEGQGMSKELKSMCDKFIYIDINEDCESLNASVAASIVLYELRD